MIRLFPLILLTLFSFSTLLAQEEINWKKHKKLADTFYESGNYLDAATHYETAWELHSKDKELIFKAAESYYLIKDFKKAIQAFQHIKTESDRFPLAGLKYARALKQDGQYEVASQAFIYFINAYQESDKAVMSNIVANEVKGCEKALELANNKEEPTLQVKLLNENINSLAIEFAPIPFTDDLLYYSSTMKENQSLLFRSQRKSGVWKKSVIADGLPSFPNKHFANGSFAPDAKRFYFTLCDNVDGLNSKCEIYVLKREGSKWSTPIRLRDYINLDDASTTTQPWVVHQNGQEILYFSSDRAGGFGQMDIWYTTRNIDSDDIDFTYPVNAGSRINTLGDEITPFYDVKNSMLYFSSNGKITLGGWDVFKAKGTMDRWGKSENLGTPINSSADEFYYVLKPSRKGGFLVSNRRYGLDKMSTQHEDIFEFGPNEKINNLFALGQVLDQETMAPLDKVRISLYELTGNKPKLLSSKIIAQSDYRFQILPGKQLRLVAEKTGYLKNIYDFTSDKNNYTIDYTHIFSLSPKTAATSMVANPSEKNDRMPNYTASTSVVDETIVANSSRNVSASSRKSRSTASATVSVVAPSNNTSVASSIDYGGTYYKVQVVAVNIHDINHPRYAKVKDIGRFETEKLADRAITRVLIADFATKSEAEVIKAQVVEGGFADAFVVKYRNGKRIGRMWN